MHLNFTQLQEFTVVRIKSDSDNFSNCSVGADINSGFRCSEWYRIKCTLLRKAVAWTVSDVDVKVWQSLCWKITLQIIKIVKCWELKHLKISLIFVVTSNEYTGNFSTNQNVNMSAILIIKVFTWVFPSCYWNFLYCVNIHEFDLPPGTSVFFSVCALTKMDQVSRKVAINCVFSEIIR